MNLLDYIWRQYIWSVKSFGPDNRLEGILKHIEKEIQEVRETGGTDLEEWIDILILTFEGIWRSGHLIQDIPKALEAKLAKNMARSWPDWRTVPKDTPIEHIKK